MGYLRCEFENNKNIDFHQSIPDGIKSVIARYFGVGWIYSSMLSMKEISELSSLLSTRLCINSAFHLELLYYSTRDGRNAYSFHSKCDGIPDTITLIQSHGYDDVFGGFTRIKWSKQNQNIMVSHFKDENELTKNGDTFLLHIRSPLVMRATRLLERKKGSKCLVQHGSSLGPCFGFEDIHIMGNMTDMHTYDRGSFPKIFITQPKSVYNLQAKKIEVFRLVIG